MRAQAELRRDLVLVGGGHAHALALRMLAMQPVAGLRITLVSPNSHTPYSGMLPGLVAGHYSYADTHIDLTRLCQWAGARFIPATVTALDPAAQCLSLAGRPDLEYDVVSIDIGSQPELDSVPGARQFATPVKPVSGLWQRWQHLEARVKGDKPLRLAVVGGGAGSVELALAMAHRLGTDAAQLTLYCGAQHILDGYNRRARGAVEGALQRAGIELRPGARVVGVEPGVLVLETGECAGFDELVWCTAAAPAEWIADSGLATDERGFLAVRDTLQSTDDERVFGAGDIATQLANPRPKAGVFAVRQAPVLAHNLRAFAMGQPLREHRPQSRFLSLLSLGERRATADRGPFTATGAWVWCWKDRIDRAFMEKFSELPVMVDVEPTQRLPELPVQPQMVCGGCGAKVGADPLGTVLQELALAFPGTCSGGADDAAELPGDVGGPLLQSLDILREIVSDPWRMGRIAALHAMSDLYACGARPVAALAAVTLPFAGARILRRDLHQLLAGALYEFERADCRLAGGHSMQGGELSLGFAVTGVPMDASGKVLEKTGARAGDALVLTAALGTGTLFAAQMRGLANGADIEAAVTHMLADNGEAARLALGHGAHACTDITGFGLLGHLLEMLGEGSGAQLRLADVPVLAGAGEQLRAGVVSTMHPANVESSQASLQLAQGVDTALAQLLYDPQTCGGLLIALPADRAADLCAALVSSGYTAAAVIGEVTQAPVAGASPVALA